MLDRIKRLHAVLLLGALLALGAGVYTSQAAPPLLTPVPLTPLAPAVFHGDLRDVSGQALGESRPVSILAPAAPATQTAPAPLLSIAGLDHAGWGTGWPPDANGDVGPDYYLQAVNTSLAVFRK